MISHGFPPSVGAKKGGVRWLASPSRSPGRYARGDTSGAGDWWIGWRENLQEPSIISINPIIGGKKDAKSVVSCGLVS